MLLNCGVGEDSRQSLGLPGDPTSPCKGNQSWIFIGRTDAEAETPILWRPDVKNHLIWKDPDAGKDWRQEEKGPTEDEMTGWHHRLDGHEFEWTLGVGDGQGGLACCNSWGCKESDTTEQLNQCYHITLFKKINFCPRRQKSSKDIMYPWGVRLCLDTMCILTEFREFFHLIQFI